MTGFHHFPHEIFREIMQYAYVHSPARHEHEEQYQLVVSSPPILASHVCRAWRRALLSDATMWTCLLVPQLKPDGIMALLRRSDSVLLNVFLELDDFRKLRHEGTSNMLSTLFQQIHRFKTLYVQISPKWSSQRRNGPVNHAQESIKQIMPYLQRPAPKLQVFCFKHIEFLTSTINLGDTFLETLFSGDAPNLTHIHHGLPDDSRGLRYPLSRNLSELYLTVPYGSFVADSDLLLDLLELSPCLKLFSLQIKWDLESEVDATSPRDRKVNLSHLQRLVLDVNCAVIIMRVLLNHLTFPPNIGWKITCQHFDLTTLPPLLELVSRAQFTALRIHFACEGFVALSLKENRKPTCINPIDNHELTYVYDGTWDVMDLRDSLMHSVELSNITHLEYDFSPGTYPLKHTTFETVFASLDCLETLFIRQHQNYFSVDDDAEACSVCLAALILYSTPSAASKRISKTKNSTDKGIAQDLVPTHSKDRSQEDTPKASLLCPLLREIIIELEAPLDHIHVSIFRMCSGQRRGGCPVQLFVRCAEMEEGVDRELQLEDYHIHVSVVPWKEE